MTNIFKSGWMKRAGSAVTAYPMTSLPVAAQSKFLSLNGSVIETTHTPTYMQAVIKLRETINQGKVVTRTPSKTTYTPLYLQVVGHPEESVGVNRFVGESNGHVNTDS